MFVIKTPNPNYDGITLGVKFNNGMAVVEDESLRKILVNDYGYIFEEISPEEPQVSAVKAPKPRKTAAKSSGK
ncbi:hypothetical protein [Paenibacillus durus]|uniref:Uncharacterized protein n=1 Tax=Paenibacillus durus TaxID=44251 RepID=A0A089IXF0_PAEDU|nr:hypothetical protein [Paenibacillus durus]AIQ13634.1 hypothetical protein PDUR_18210 [Paenibacillus durus]